LLQRIFIEVIRTWASDWLARYREEGIEGQRDRPKSGRPPELSQEVVLRIRKKIKESRQDWTTKQVDGMMIVKEGGGIRYHSHHHHIYRLLHKWGFKQKVPRKVHVNTASEEEKQEFKKEHRESQTTYLMASL
jgi:transposase